METVSPTEMFLVNCPSSDKALEPTVVEAHKSYLPTLGARLVIGAHASPSSGSHGPDRLYVVKAATADEAKSLIMSDPFAVAGGYQSVSVIPLKVLIGTTIGGKAWQILQRVFEPMSILSERPHFSCRQQNDFPSDFLSSC